MECFNSRTIMYASLNNSSDEFFEFLNLIQQLKKSSVQWNLLERNLAIAEHENEAAIIDKMVVLTPRLMESASFSYAPNALVRGDYVLQSRETPNEQIKNALEVLAEKENETQVTVAENESSLESSSDFSEEDASDVSEDVAEQNEELATPLPILEVQPTEESISEDELQKSSSEDVDNGFEETESQPNAESETMPENITEEVNSSEEVVSDTSNETEENAADKENIAAVYSTAVQAAEEAKKKLLDAQEQILRQSERVQALKNSFMEGYEFPNDCKEKEYTVGMYQRCSELNLKSKVLATCLIFAHVENSEKAVYDATAKALGINSAMVKMDARKSYIKWVKTYMPDFYKDFPETTIADFLNVFRDGKKMF